MQEEVENRTLTLVVSGTKFTGRLFKAAVCKYMAYRREKKMEKQRSRDSPVIPHGKQSVKQLIGQNQGVSNLEITDPSIREFEKIARKYGVDYAVKKDRGCSPPKYLIFFKARDAVQFAPHGGHWCVCQRPPGGAQRPPSLRYFDRLNNNNVMLRCPLHNSVG